MGGGRYKPEDFTAYASSMGRSATTPTSHIFTSRAIVPGLDPKGVAVRESRDSIDNPNSTPLIIALDVTGSMGMIADVMAKTGLPTLMSEIYSRKPIEDPHVMGMGIGDVEAGDSAPLQVTQFEADMRITLQLEQIWLEHGGGNHYESYALAWFFASRHTVSDSMAKRNKKGYPFTIGDEHPTPYLREGDIQRVMGYSPESDIDCADLLNETLQKWEVFHLLVAEGSHMRHAADSVRQAWAKLLGQRAVLLTDHTKLAEVLVSIIQVNEGVDPASVAASWGHGTSSVVSAAVSHMAGASAWAMKIHAVIGANYGDEGKGLMTDMLSDDRTLVVRYNGGSQAGHTVVRPDGAPHTFRHFGAGTFQGASTFLSRFFIVNPIQFMRENHELLELGLKPVVWVDPLCLVTTPFDMLINQNFELRQQSRRRHGTCGLGINETVTRSEHLDYRVSVNDFFRDPELLRQKLENIEAVWTPMRCEALGIRPPTKIHGLIDRYMKDIGLMVFRLTVDNDVLRNADFDSIVFEGAQGLGLDEVRGTFPYVTRSRTGLTNVVTLMDEAGYTELTALYVTRAYLTRHGRGPMDDKPEHDTHPWGWVGLEHNRFNMFQEQFRYSVLDTGATHRRMEADSADRGPVTVKQEIAVTCLDQVPRYERPSCTVSGYDSHGPTRKNVERVEGDVICLPGIASSVKAAAATSAANGQSPMANPFA